MGTQEGASMKEESVKAEHALILRRRFGAPAERVFQALTRPGELRRWFGPSETYRVPVVEVDLRPGGAYRIELHSPEGNVFRLAGIYREVLPPHRLAYTWRWEGEEDIGETLVTIDLREAGGGTDLSITQAPFSTEDARKRHEAGWSGSLSRLESIF